MVDATDAVAADADGAACAEGADVAPDDATGENEAVLAGALGGAAA
jgi:hypothetical protein